MWMNRYEVEEARDRYQSHPVLGPATRFLYDFMEEANDHSDGWHSWPSPGRAAAKLQTLIRASRLQGLGLYPRVPEPTLADVRKTLGPVKSFYTRRGFAAGMKMPEFK
jgi:hypothetical protein